VNLMPRKTTKRIAPKNSTAKKPQSKTKFILALPTTLAAKDVVAKGKAAGLTFTGSYVWQTRTGAKERAARVGVPAVTGRKPGPIARFVLAQDPALSAPEIVTKAKSAGFDITAHRVHNILWREKQKGKAKASVKAAPAAKTVKVKPTKATPSKAKPAAAKVAKPTKSTTKAAYVLGFAAGTPAADIVAAGNAKGIKLSTAHVYAIRTAAKAKAKKGKAGSAPAKAKPGKVQRAVRRAAPRPAPSAPASSAIAGIAPLDLAYAVGRLVESGTTTAAEIAQLAAERTSRIGSLEAELAALRGGNVPVVYMAKVAQVRKARKSRKAVAKPKAVKPAAEPKKSKAKAVKGKVMTRVDGRKFTMTAKALAARKLQGTYLGHLRQVPDAEKGAFKLIAKEEGVAAAVAELKKRLGKK